METTATIKYRSYVPDGWMAFKMCNISFSGKDQGNHSSNCTRISLSVYKQRNDLKDKIQNYRNSQTNEIQEIKNKWSFFDSIKYLFGNKQISIIRCKYNKLIDDSELELEYGIGIYIKQKIGFERYLQENGFVLDNTTNSGQELPYDILTYKK